MVIFSEDILMKFLKKAQLEIIFLCVMSFSLASTTTLAQSVTGFNVAPIGDKFLVGAELGYDFSPSSGAGLTLRGQKEVDPQAKIDGGLTISGGQREQNLFLGMTYQFFPDYGPQPQFNVRGAFEFVQIDDEHYNNILLAPIFSKGVRIVGQDYYLFAGLPARILVGDKKTQEKRFSLGVNAGGNVPMDFWSPGLVGSVEMYFNIRKSYNAITVGLAKTF